MPDFNWIEKCFTVFDMSAPVFFFFFFLYDKKYMESSLHAVLNITCIGGKDQRIMPETYRK